MTRSRTITILDYGVGNIGSLLNMLDFIGIECRVAERAADITTAESMILPGVGAFDTAMRELKIRDLISPPFLLRRFQYSACVSVCKSWAWGVMKANCQDSGG
jgi:imidazoleglycerol phosphate synthase glutamine amidotransferase subunit HisH